MKGNWGSAILLYVVSCVLYVPYGILNRGGAIAGLAVLLLIFVYLPINFGLLRTFLAFARDKRPLTIEGLFCAFNNTYYWKAIGTGLLSGIYTFLWTLLLIVPGIIKGLSYAMALYIVSDNPEIGCDEAIERSMAMMRGHKMRLFLMQLGMIGWSLLSLLTLGIAMLWIVPYYQTVFANFTLKSRPNTKRPGMRLKEQPIAPAIGTEKTGPRSNAISRSCFFVLSEDSGKSKRQPHLPLPLVRIRSLFRRQIAGIACQAQNPCGSDTAPLLLEPTEHPVRCDSPLH